jgi:hypothetical protein
MALHAEVTAGVQGAQSIDGAGRPGDADNQAGSICLGHPMVRSPARITLAQTYVI